MTGLSKGEYLKFVTDIHFIIIKEIKKERIFTITCSQKCSVLIFSV